MYPLYIFENGRMFTYIYWNNSPDSGECSRDIVFIDVLSVIFLKMGHTVCMTWYLSSRYGSLFNA